MIFDPGTVLVLGAGASSPYGFPLGKDLKKMMIKNTEMVSSTQGKQFLDAGFSEKDVSDFHTDLNRSIHPTIDAFLEDRPSRREIGAFAIAQVLMPLEREETLYPHRDWYPTLFNEINLRDYSHTAPVTAIITLNYDRSLEHYLAETTQRTYEGVIRDKAFEKLETVKIIHAHGQLGSYQKMAYTPQKSTDDIKTGAKGISLIHDQHLDGAEEFQEASALIATATDILFLGFGYDQRTLKRLGVLNIQNGPNFYGTAYEMAHASKAELQKQFENRIQLDNSNSQVVNYLPNFHEMKLRERADQANKQAAELAKSQKTSRITHNQS